MLSIMIVLNYINTNSIPEFPFLCYLETLVFERCLLGPIFLGPLCVYQASSLCVCVFGTGFFLSISYELPPPALQHIFEKVKKRCSGLFPFPGIVFSQVLCYFPMVPTTLRHRSSKLATGQFHKTYTPPQILGQGVLCGSFHGFIEIPNVIGILIESTQLELP